MKTYNYFYRSTKSQSKGFQALGNLGSIHMLNKEYELARKCLMNSFKINSKYVPTINNLAAYYHKVHDPINALYYLQNYHTIKPNNPLALIRYAKALIISGEVKKQLVYSKN